MNTPDVIEQPRTVNGGSQQRVVGQPRQYGIKVCWGADPKWSTLPISNLPANVIKVRRRIRNTQTAKAYLKTETEIQQWVLAPDGESAVKLEILQGINSRLPND